MSELALPAQPRRSPALTNGARHRSINSRYIQALRTYIRPIPIAIAALALLASLYPVCHTQDIMQYACAGGTCMTAAVIAMVSVFQLRYQLDASRSALTPGFRAPHFFAAAIVLLVLNTATPLAIFLLTGFSFISFLAYTLFLTAMLAWMCYEPLGMILLFTLLFNLVPAERLFRAVPPHEYYIGSAASLNRSQSLLVPGFGLAFAVVSLAALFAIYSRLNGENSSQPASSQQLTLRIRPRMHDGRINFPLGPVTRLAGTLLIFLQARLEILLQRRNAPITLSKTPSFLATVNHRRRVTFFGISPAFFALVLHITILICIFTGAWGPPAAAADDASLPLFFFFFPASLWILMSGIFWPKQWLYLPTESLFPAPRPRFIRELGAALALDSLSFWTTSSLLALLAAILIFPHEVAHQLARAALCCLTTASILVFCYGLFTWTMLFRNVILSGVALFVAVAALIFSINDISEHLLPPVGTFLPQSFIWLTLAGAALAARAHHRWLRTDLS